MPTIGNANARGTRRERMAELARKVKGCELSDEVILKTQGLTATGFADILKAIHDSGWVQHMNAYLEAERMFETLSRAEKAQVLQWVVRDLGDAFPGIESRPDVCGGEACIVRTRIPVWLLVRARQLGVSEAELLRVYPTLRAEDLVNTWGYYRGHRSEIEEAIGSNEEA